MPIIERVATILYRGGKTGAAIVPGVASDPGALPLLGIAVSGIGVGTPDTQEVDAFARRFAASPRVDAAMVRDTGHCMDFHTIGSALHLEQLGLALQCAVEA